MSKRVKKPAIFGPNARKVYWTVRIGVDPVWVADGFELTDDNLHEAICELLPYAQFEEIETKVVLRPKASRIRKLQGESE